MSGAERSDVRILGIAGSLRGGSYNRKLLHSACELAVPGIEIVPWEALKAIPPFDEDDEEAPAARCSSCGRRSPGPTPC